MLRLRLNIYFDSKKGHTKKGTRNSLQSIVQVTVAKISRPFQDSLHTCSREMHLIGYRQIQVYHQVLHKEVKILLGYHNCI